MKKTKSTLSFLLVVILALSVFTLTPVSASAKGVEKNAKLKIWVPDKEVSKAKKIAKKFVKKYKSKKIKIKVKCQSEADAGTFLLADPASAADVANITADQIYNLTRAKVISPIKKPKSIKKSELKGAVSAFTVNKKLYAVPKSCFSYCLVYDKNVVSSSSAKTLEGVLKACKDKNKKFMMDSGNGYYNCIFLFTGSLRPTGIDSDGITQKFNKYDINKLTKTLKSFSKLFHKYKNVFSLASASEALFSLDKGKAGAAIDGLWDYKPLKKSLGKRFGAAKLPTISVDGKKVQPVNFFSYTGYGVNKYSKYPNAAQAFAKFIGKKAYQKERVSLNYIPTNKKLLKTKTVKKNVMMKALINQQKHSVPQSKISSHFWDPVGNLGNKITDKNINPDTYNYQALIKITLEHIKEG